MVPIGISNASLPTEKKIMGSAQGLQGWGGVRHAGWGNWAHWGIQRHLPGKPMSDCTCVATQRSWVKELLFKWLFGKTARTILKKQRIHCLCFTHKNTLGSADFTGCHPLLCYRWFWGYFIPCQKKIIKKPPSLVVWCELTCDEASL